MTSSSVATEMDAQLISSLLAASIDSLDTSIAGALEDPQVKIQLDLVIRVLRMVAAHIGKHDEAVSDLSQGAQLLLPGFQAAEPNGGRNVSPIPGVNQHSEILEALADQVPVLFDSAKEGGDSVVQLKKLVGVMEDYHLSLDPDIAQGSAVVFRGGSIDRTKAASERPVVSSEKLQDYLRQRFPDCPDLAVTHCQQIVGGFSKATVMFDVCWQPGQPAERLFMRKDLPVCFMNKSVVNEFPILEELHRAGVNVPKPLWLEQDTGIFSGAFMVMDKVAGSTNAAEWSDHAGAVVEQLAEVMASFHRLPLSTVLPQSGAKNAGDAMEIEINDWRHLYQRRRGKRHPLIELILNWLDNNIPAELYRRPGRLIHGDVGFHNLMVADGNASGLLDWEFAHAGDPAEDLLYIKPFVEQLGMWNAFCDAYQVRGGIAVSEQCEQFFKVWSFARNAIGTVDARYLFKHHLPGELKLAVAGFVFGCYLELDASKMVISLLTGSEDQAATSA